MQIIVSVSLVKCEMLDNQNIFMDISNQCHIKTYLWIKLDASLLLNDIQWMNCYQRNVLISIRIITETFSVT